MYAFVNSAVIFDNSFNEALDDTILNDIRLVKQIVFGYIFNNSIDNLNTHITHLELGVYFNKSTNILKNFKVMTHLKITHVDDDEIFPTSLIWLCINGHSIKLNNLPSGLLYLINIMVDTKVEILHYYDNLPSKLLYLEDGMINYCDNLPSSLKYLKFNYNNDHINYDTVLYNLPNKLHYLSLINTNENTKFNYLTQNLYYLKVSLIDKNPEIIFSKYLLKLVIYVSSIYDSINLSKVILPHKLKYLVCQFNFNSLNIPNSVEKFVIGYLDNILQLYLPKQLKILVVALIMNHIEIYFNNDKIYKNIVNNYNKLYEKCFINNIELSLLNTDNFEDITSKFESRMNNILDPIHLNLNIPNMLSY